ncbi:hypothetical protein Jann_0822 [Jannaschia sp. CCS1]|nr:hypothetical protein Jann_0822 [Jannaschia sp. CCS1]
MPLARLLTAVLCLALIGCGIPPLNTATVSQTPAGAAQFALAQRAVQACGRLPDTDAARSALGRVGLSGDGTIMTSSDQAVIVLMQGGRCAVGLRSMTPEQSHQLAQSWVRTYDAISNAEAGDGLSPLVIGAWRSFTPNRRVFIAAHRTWPNEYSQFPDVAGAAVTLSYTILGPRSGTPAYTYTLR